MTVIVDDLSLLCGEELNLINKGCIVLDDGKITYAGENSPPTHYTEPTITLNGRGLLAIPGLIDAHTHIADSVAKDIGIGSNLDSLVHPINGLKTRILNETPQATLSQGIESTGNRMLASGVTTFADFREGGLAGIQLARNALCRIGAHAILLGRPNHHFSREEVRDSSATLDPQAADELLRTIEIANGLGISGANEYTENAMKQISDLAKAKGKLVGIHACESEESNRFSLASFSKTEVERSLSCLQPDFLVHLTNAGKEDLERVARTHVPVVCCPRANSILGLGFPPVFELLERGVTVALGTDNVMLASPDMFREMEFTSRMLRGTNREPRAISSKAVLKMATINGARALGLGSTTGSIEEGKGADVVFLDMNTPNLTFSRDVIGSVVHRAGPEDVKCVIVDGEIEYGSIPPA